MEAALQVLLDALLGALIGPVGNPGGGETVQGWFAVAVERLFSLFGL
jgi:hypothetical protein